MRKSSIPFATSQGLIRLTAIQWVKIPLALAASLGLEENLFHVAQFLHLNSVQVPDLTLQPIPFSVLAERTSRIHPELIPVLRDSLQTLVQRKFAIEPAPDTYAINPAWIEWRSANGKPALSRKARFAIGLLITIG